MSYDVFVKEDPDSEIGYLCWAKGREETPEEMLEEIKALQVEINAKKAALADRSKTASDQNLSSADQ